MKMRKLYPLVLVCLFGTAQPARAGSFFFHIDLFTPLYSFYPYDAAYWPVYDYPYSGYYYPNIYLHYHYPLIAYYYPAGYVHVPYYTFYTYPFSFYFNLYSHHHHRHYSHKPHHYAYSHHRALPKNYRYYYPDRRNRYHDQGINHRRKYDRSDNRSNYRNDHRNTWQQRNHAYWNNRNYQPDRNRQRHENQTRDDRDSGVRRQQHNHTDQSENNHSSRGNFNGQEQNRSGQYRDNLHNRIPGGRNQANSGYDNNPGYRNPDPDERKLLRKNPYTQLEKRADYQRQPDREITRSDRDNRDQYRDRPGINMDSYRNNRTPRSMAERGSSRYSTGKQYRKRRGDDSGGRSGNYRAFR